MPTFEVVDLPDDEAIRKAWAKGQWPPGHLPVPKGLENMLRCDCRFYQHGKRKCKYEESGDCRPV